MEMSSKNMQQLSFKMLHSAVVKFTVNGTEYKHKRYEKLMSVNPTNATVLLN